MKTREFNLQDWTGRSVVISYRVKDRSFEFNGERFTLGKFEHHYRGMGTVDLFGESWGNDVVKSLIVETDYRRPNELENAIVAAVRYAAMYI